MPKITLALAAFLMLLGQARAHEDDEAKACSIHKQGHPQAYFEACTKTVKSGQILLETPNGERFSITNKGRSLLWFIDGAPAKQIKLTTMTCYENHLISICFQGGFGF
jgi:hypothetical protein